MRSLVFSAFLFATCAIALIGCSEAADDNADDQSQEVSCDPSQSDVEQCGEDEFCAYKHLAGREETDEGICHEHCLRDDDCPSQRPNCTSGVVEDTSVCSEADYSPWSCDPEATGDDCECGIGDNEAFLVEGTGDDCEIIEEDITACFEQANTCLNACVPEFYRYELGDGTAIIALGLQGSISEGWEGDGQHTNTPSSCPAIERDTEL